VAIYRLLQNQAFTPADITAMTTAYEKALVDLDLERTDARTELLAKRIIEVAQTGIRDPAKICALAIEGLDLPEPKP
jgi:hypothetical protein